MKPVMIHADGTDCGHEGTPRATAHDDGGPRCAAGILVTRIRINGQEFTVEEATGAFSKLGAAFIEAARLLADAVSGPVFDQLAETAHRVRDHGEIQPEQGPCHCLCAKTHPADRGICDMEAVTTRHYETELLGPVDVALCAPCAAAQFLAEVT